ncbi:Lpg1974 family pore-forming outer membrane protein [Legionella nagasakiensis]|uniref:Lpg1974 family pore-forming outer membrane protein n=1 Tax=Legionella nagasakiensis TaxID=535290 RepID=UPI0013EF8F8F|nr:Lpg1974 family pore-forming outer membrane protein [Legionella nagasakiensis]
MLKKLLPFAVLGALMNPFHTSLAGEMGSAKEGRFDVYVPNLPASNEFTAGAVFLRPGGSNDYAVLVNPFNPNVATPILSPSWEPKGINPDFNAGLLLNFRHVFSNSGNDINVYWTHLRTSDDATFPVSNAAPPEQQMTGPFWVIGPDAGPTRTARGQVKYDYDVLNVDLAKHVHFDPNLKSRFFMGVGGLWLEQKLIADFTGNDPVLGPYTFDITSTSKYNAAGIRLGMDGEYQGMYDINVVGALAGALYIGSQQPSYKTAGTSGTLTDAGIPVNHQAISHKSYVQVVPAVDAKLGLKYSRQFSNDKSFAIEGGYMAAIYVNAIQNYLPSTYVPGSQGIITGSFFLQSLLKATDSFSVDGPYVTASLKI